MGRRARLSKPTLSLSGAKYTFRLSRSSLSPPRRLTTTQGQDVSRLTPLTYKDIIWINCWSISLNQESPEVRSASPRFVINFFYATNFEISSNVRFYWFFIIQQAPWPTSPASVPPATAVRLSRESSLPLSSFGNSKFWTFVSIEDQRKICAESVY